MNAPSPGTRRSISRPLARATPPPAAAPLAAPLLALALLTACEAPPVFPGADKRQNARNARIEGTVVVSSAARGNVVVFLFDAARPPPPAGTGRPLAFTVLAEADVFGAVGPADTGPFVAPYTFSLVAPGRYLLRGFVDANHDFIPWYSVTADVNAGDVGGAAVDAVTRAPRVVEVPAGEGGRPAAAVDVPVSFSDAARVTVDRPVFEHAGGAADVPLGAGAAVDLDSRELNEGAVGQPNPLFLARLVDDDGDGVPDDSNRDGVPDFWPRVVVRKLADGPNPLLDENDLDKNGVLDATGADYEHLNPANGAVVPADGAPDLVVLAAGFDFAALLPQLVDGTGRPKAQPTPVTRLRLVVQPRAFDASNPAQPQPLREVPRGRYAITVIQLTGQTWRTPNELMPGVAEGAGLPVVSSQALVVMVP